MKNFRIKIRYCGYSADFDVTCEDTPQGIENSILDKLGKNEVKFEKNGFTCNTGKWITYEEVIDARDLYITKKSLELEWEQEHLKEGKHNIRMIEINRQIQDIIKQIVAQEFEEATLQTKIKDAKPEVSIAT